MSKLLQVRLDDKLKSDADNVFSSMGLDTSTAVRMFLTAAVETRSLPFEVKAHKSSVKSGKVWVDENDIMDSWELVPSSLVKAAGLDGWDEEGFVYYYDNELTEDDNEVKFGGWEGKIFMTEDFNAPMEEFEEYM